MSAQLTLQRGSRTTAVTLARQRLEVAVVETPLTVDLRRQTITISRPSTVPAPLPAPTPVEALPELIVSNTPPVGRTAPWLRIEVDGDGHVQRVLLGTP